MGRIDSVVDHREWERAQGRMVEVIHPLHRFFVRVCVFLVVDDEEGVAT